MSKAINTIARGVEAGALKTGASQYLEAIEAAKQDIGNNQLLFILSGSSDEVETDTVNEETVKLYTFENDVKELTRVNDRSIKIAYLAPTIEVLGDEVFGGQTELTEVYMPSKLKVVGTAAFAGSEHIVKMELPEGLERIGELAFAGLGMMEEIRIPDSVTEIGADAFAEVPHIYYHGTATGAPWGALAMN